MKELLIVCRGEGFVQDRAVKQVLGRYIVDDSTNLARLKDSQVQFVLSRPEKALTPRGSIVLESMDFANLPVPFLDAVSVRSGGQYSLICLEDGRMVNEVPILLT